MQATWVKQGASDRLLVLALGWAGEPRMIEHLLWDGDLLCLWDYRTVELPEGLTAQIDSYTHRHLLAWSFGVWAAAHLFGERIAWDSAVALNGTPRPVDPDLGIPPRAFAVTLKSLETAGTLKFLERMCGPYLQEYLRHRSLRPLDEVVDELKRLAQQAVDDPRLPWSRAVVGERDQIFPPGAMIAYWESSDVPVTTDPDLPHYPFYRPDCLAQWLR